MTTNILFLGMNRLSTSLGLAMKKNKENLNRMGYDPDVNNTKYAIESGALDRSVEIIAEGAKSADVIIYALPIGNMLEVLDSLRQDLKQGCFIVDLNPIGSDTFNQVSKVLPDPNSFIAWFAALNPKTMMDLESGPRNAQEDLFQGSHVYIAGDFNTHPEALKLGNDLAVLAGALPLNTEPEELAGILALGIDLPLLVSAVTTRLLTSEPGWNEARKLAGLNFNQLSSPLDLPDNQATPDSRMRANRKNLQRLLSLLIDHLSQIHTELDDDESKELAQVVNNAVLARQIWYKQRTTMSWLEQDQVKPQAIPGFSERLLGKRRK
jgi:prephenate dehydrogenase